MVWCVLSQVKPSELYILSCEKGLGLRPWPLSQLRMFLGLYPIHNTKIESNNSWISTSYLECELLFIHLEDNINFVRALSECWLSLESVTLKSLEDKLINPFLLNDSDSEIPILEADPDLQYYSYSKHADNLLNCSYYVESTIFQKAV